MNKKQRKLRKQIQKKCNEKNKHKNRNKSIPLCWEWACLNKSNVACCVSAWHMALHHQSIHMRECLCHTSALGWRLNLTTSQPWVRSKNKQHNTDTPAMEVCYLQKTVFFFHSTVSIFMSDTVALWRIAVFSSRNLLEFIWPWLLALD